MARFPANFQIQAAANAANAAGTGGPPRLSVFLNTSPPAFSRTGPPTPNRSDVDLVKETLRDIKTVLEQGLDSAWGGATTDLDERWARTVTGMMMCAHYFTPSVLYMTNALGNDDSPFWDSMTKPGGFFPLCICCQQSCTVALITRGFTKAHFLTGLNAGGSEGLPVFQLPGASWQKANDLRSAEKACGATAKAGPGTIFEFFNDDPSLPNGGKNFGFAHIAYVLRTGATPARLQLFDTGGMNDDKRDEPSVMVKSMGTYDDPWTEKIKGPSGGEGHFSGMGTLPPSPNLAAALDAADRLRPLGFVRLVLSGEQDPKNVLYSTPLLPMHATSGETHNFSLARLMWAIRGLTGITAEWRVFMPRSALAVRVMGGTRENTLFDLKDLLPGPKELITGWDKFMWLCVLRNHAGVLSYERKAPRHDHSKDNTLTNDKLGWGVAGGSAQPALKDIDPWYWGGQAP